MSDCKGCGETVAQNDIADFLQKVIALLQRLAGFFDGLTGKQAAAQGLTVGPCEQALIDGVKGEFLKLLTTLPSQVQAYLHCKLGFTQPASTQSLAGLGSIVALLPQLMQLVKYLPQLIALWKQLQESGLLGNLPGAPTGPTQPVMPTADYSPRSVQRCG